MAKGSSNGGSGAATLPAPQQRPQEAPRRDFLVLLEQSREPLARLLPDGRKVDRVLRIARTAYQLNADLRRCTPESILGAVMKAAELDLEPGGALKHAWLIPYGTECQFQISYLGMLKLARRSGEFRSIEAVAVQEKDRFRVWRDPLPRIEHEPCLEDDPGPLTHAYAYAKLANGEVVFEVMTRREIEAIRQRHVRGNSPAWRDYFGEMSKKTVLKRFLKRQESSVEVAEAIELDNQDYEDAGPGRATAQVAPGTSRSETLTRRLAPPEPEPEFHEGTAGQITSEAEEAPQEHAREPGED